MSLGLGGVLQPLKKVHLHVLTSSKTYLDGAPEELPWQFEIWVNLVGPGGLDHIDITKPGTSTPFVTLYEDEPIRWGDFDSHPYPTLLSLRVDYPEGPYKFEFYDSSDTLLKTVVLDYSDFPGGPTGPVNIMPGR